MPTESLPPTTKLTVSSDAPRSPRTEAGKALLQSLAEMAEHQAAGLSYIKPPARFVSTGRDAILAIEAEAAVLAPVSTGRQVHFVADALVDGESAAAPRSGELEKAARAWVAEHRNGRTCTIVDCPTATALRAAVDATEVST